MSLSSIAIVLKRFETYLKTSGDIFLAYDP